MEGIIIVKKLKILKQQLSDISQIEKNVDDSITIDEEQMNLLSQKNFVEALYNELESIQIQAKNKKNNDYSEAFPQLKKVKMMDQSIQTNIGWKEYDYELDQWIEKTEDYLGNIMIKNGENGEWVKENKIISQQTKQVIHSSIPTPQSSKIHTRVLWDIQNIRIKKHHSTVKTVSMLHTFLKNKNAWGVGIDGRITCFVGLNDLPPAVSSDLDKANIELVQVTPKKEDADRKLKQRITNETQVLSPYNTCFVIISSDLDFRTDIVNLRNDGYRVILLHNASTDKNNDTFSLHADEAYKWDDCIAINDFCNDPDYKYNNYDSNYNANYNSKYKHNYSNYYNCNYNKNSYKSNNNYDKDNIDNFNFHGGYKDLNSINNIDDDDDDNDDDDNDNNYNEDASSKLLKFLGVSKNIKI